MGYIVRVEVVVRDKEAIKRIQAMFAEYTLDDCFSFSTDPGDEWIAFERNGFLYTLCYHYDKLTHVTIEPV